MAQHRPPGIDAFWEQADRESSPQDPIERELNERADALARYRRLIAEAEANGRDGAAEILRKNLEREERTVQRLWEALSSGQASSVEQQASRP